MNSLAREKLFKSWSGISEVNLIKEVATKGESIQLCIEYGARKRKIPLAEYELFFHDVVQTYVQRLLSERLVLKAENVLNNVQRNVRCFYFQFACESKDHELREVLLDHLSKKDPHGFEESLPNLQFHWELLQLIQAHPTTLAKCKSKLRRINLEALLQCDSEFLERMMAELYFENRNEILLHRLNKSTVWTHLVDKQMELEIIRWCAINHGLRKTEILATHASALEFKFKEWPLEADMFEYALREMKTPGEVLRNAFAAAGYFFADERDSVLTLLRRICSTESFAVNKELLEKLPLGRMLLQRGYYSVMLQSFVSTRELDELAEEMPEQSHLLKFIGTLKCHDIQDRVGFEKISSASRAFLESCEVDFDSEQPLVTLFDFLCTEPSIANLNCFLLSSSLKRIAFLHSLAQQMELGVNSCAKNLPSPYDLMQKFRSLDMGDLQRETHDVASFSNEHLTQKYSRKYQLNFLHYLKQHRSAFAVYYFLTEQLQHYSQITKSQLFSVCETVADLALQQDTNLELITHCVAFSEMMGFDSQNLRNFLNLCRLVDAAGVSSYSGLIAKVERGLEQQLSRSPERFPLTEYQALMRMVACNQFHQWPELVMRFYARENDWWRLLVLLQYSEVPLPQVKAVIEHFENRTMAEHLQRALSHEPTPQSSSERSGRRHSSFSRQLKLQTRKLEVIDQMTASIDTLTSSMGSGNDPYVSGARQGPGRHLIDIGDKLDLFALILLSASPVTSADERLAGIERFLEIIQDSGSHSTAINLMKNSVKYNNSILGLLSATVCDVNVDWNWFVWLAVSTNQWTEVLRAAVHEPPTELSWRLIETSVRQGFTGPLYRSFCIFFQANPIAHLFKFLHVTQSHRDFSEAAEQELRLYLLAWSNNEVSLPLSPAMKREELMLRSIKLLLVHLQLNFDSSLEQQKLLTCICRTDVSDISGLLDFCRLYEVFKIHQSSTKQRFSLNFERLLQRDHHEYEQMLVALREAKEYDLAIRLATRLQMPICDMVYAKWVADLEMSGADGGEDDFTFQRYEQEIVEHSLPPEVLVNFFLFAASSREGTLPWTRKYSLLREALNVIKRNHLFPNESFDRDQIEYDMIVCYLRIEDEHAARSVEIYHSEYYEEIMAKERCVLYKSFQELKELAGIDDLTAKRKPDLTEPMLVRLEALLNRLLDEGDIVEALRLQELFECRPIDLRFVVFCMALAEGVTTVFSLTSEERQMLRDMEKSSFAKFNRRTLGLGSAIRGSSGSQPAASDLSDSNSTLEFEEIPSKEKCETLDTIQGIASKLKYGVTIGRRIVMAYRAALYLDKEYFDILRTKDITVLLKSVAEEECLQRLQVVSDILTSTHTSAQEIAELMAFEITTAVVRPRFYIFSSDQQARNTFKNADLWGYNIDRDLHLFLELTPNTTLLGYRLLEYCDALKAYRKYQDNKPYDHSPVFERLVEIITRYGLPTLKSSLGHSSPATAGWASEGGGSTALSPVGGSGGSGGGGGGNVPQVLSHKKQNLIYVELLIKAHQCFVHECSMEGIANVLSRAKSLNSVLAMAKSWSLIVRMLSGIARYREMFYCFDTLIANDQFESLLGQFDEDKAIGLRQAILAYLREYCPENSREYLRLAALHFLMYTELAEMWERDTRALIDQVLAMAYICSAVGAGEQDSMASLTTAHVQRTFIPKLKAYPEVVALLQQALENYSHATENYLLDNKLLLAQKSAHQAELIAMQIDLTTKAMEKNTNSNGPMMCVCVMNVQSRDEFRELVNSELSVPQSLILSRAYGYDINWSVALLSQYLILRRKSYLQEYLQHLPINDGLIENVIKGYQLYILHRKPSSNQSPIEDLLAQLVDLVQSITLKYKLASLLGIKAVVISLINDQSVYYLRDTSYGRSESDRMPDI